VSLAIYAQAVLGGVVSSTGAGAACPDWPTCNGAWFPPLSGLVAVQMAHRWIAYALAPLLVALAWRAHVARERTVAILARSLLAVLAVQMAIGVLNVLFGIRPYFSALHIANAAVMLAGALTATFRVASLPAPRPVRIAAPALS
jgi:cytochrome c oxidase assembly protein subunit 15